MEIVSLADLGRSIDAKPADGFFICPDDRINRRIRYPKLVLEESIIDLFTEIFPSITEDVEVFYSMLGTFDRLDYETFKIGAKLAFLFAATDYAQSNRVTSPWHFYRKQHKKSIIRNQRKHLDRFLLSATNATKRLSIRALHRHAIRMLEQKFEVPHDMKDLNRFARTRKFAPYGMLVGDAFEKQFQEHFERDPELRRQLKKRIPEEASLIPLDNTSFPPRIKVPDYLVLTENKVIPVDLKLNLRFAEKSQISRKNLERLLRTEQLRRHFP